MRRKSGENLCWGRKRGNWSVGERYAGNGKMEKTIIDKSHDPFFAMVAAKCKLKMDVGRLTSYHLSEQKMINDVVSLFWFQYSNNS